MIRKIILSFSTLMLGFSISLAAQDMSNTDTMGSDRNIRDFDKIVISGGLKVSIITADDYSVTIIGNSKAVASVQTELQNSTLFIRQRTNSAGDPGLVVKINLPNLHSVTLDGATAVSLSVSNLNAQSNLYLNLSGSSSITGRINYNTLSVISSGASRLNLKGLVDSFTLEASGAVSTDTSALQARMIKADLSGVIDARLYATDSMEITGQGTGIVRYLAHPQIIAHFDPKLITLKQETP